MKNNAEQIKNHDFEPLTSELKKARRFAEKKLGRKNITCESYFTKNHVDDAGFVAFKISFTSDDDNWTCCEVQLNAFTLDRRKSYITEVLDY